MAWLLDSDPWVSFENDTEMKLDVPLCALRGKGAKCAWRSRLRMQLRMLQIRSWTAGNNTRRVQGDSTRLDETRG